MSKEVHDKCGVFGIYDIHEASRLAFFGLFALNHRGQESTGIVSSDGETMCVRKDNGLVNQVFQNDEDIDSLPGHIAVGHVKYGTDTKKGSTTSHIQPVTDENTLLAWSHNGTISDTRNLKSFLWDKNTPYYFYNDSEMMAAAVRHFLSRGANLLDAVREAYPLFTGAFSVVAATKNEMIALRDRCGIKPLSMGQINGGVVFASETCAIETIGATFIRDVEPGEMVSINPSGIKSEIVAPDPDPKFDIFELIYFSRPDSYFRGKQIHEYRKNFGRQLARELRINADIVIGIPDSGLSAAEGYAEESRIPLRPGFIKNRYIGRTFIHPAQKMREKNIEIKLNPLREEIAGKDVIWVDDSIVRGNTSPRSVAKLKNAGARRIHAVISSSPVMFPNFYGIDTAKQEELIAYRMRGDVEKIKYAIGGGDLTTLKYLSLDGMISATGFPRKIFCTSDFTGEYPIDIGERAKEIRDLRTV